MESRILAAAHFEKRLSGIVYPIPEHAVVLTAADGCLTKFPQFQQVSL
jgi:hypothetical protein